MNKPPVQTLLTICECIRQAEIWSEDFILLDKADCIALVAALGAAERRVEKIDNSRKIAYHKISGLKKKISQLKHTRAALQHGVRKMAKRQHSLVKKLMEKYS